MTGIEIAQMLLDQDGYIVMASYEKRHNIGDVIRDDGLESTSETPGPFVVIGNATREDALRQLSLIPDEYRWVDNVFDGAIGFYKVTAE